MRPEFVSTNSIGFFSARGGRFRYILALALVATSVFAAAAGQGTTGNASTASIGIRLVVAPAIHGRQMSLSTRGDDALPSSSAGRLCLTLIDIAGITLGLPAPGDPVSRLTAVDFEWIEHADCAGRALDYRLPYRSGVTTLVVRPI